ncbi:unnamed protein product [Spodoptera littoralis]|uniref:Uncharacterized protein n=1 Tax=Spodoptera littoralis TaxID=7109 RepID=A0A9P0HZJ4_SPOLI|nr:unnamed protein product [Spodoptera littoralis]CAH1637302.1 unnamed protein product [Spodoptera littoralis]
MMFTRNIKLWLCVACLASSLAAPAPSQGPQLYLDIIDMAAISRMSPQQLEALAEGLAAEEIMRTKRSSAQALTSVVSKASSGLQSKVGLLGQASAFIASASSKSGGHGEESHGYNYEPHQEDEKYDYWGLKKSILYTLFQAVKAITGGVTILKGQLIKGGGALAATLGKVISSKGDACDYNPVCFKKKDLPHTKFFSCVVATAVYGPPPTAHLEYGPPTAYGTPTAPAHFTAPSVPTGYAAHKYPSQLDGYHDPPHPHRDEPQFYKRLGRGKLNGVHAGLVILTPLGDVAPSETLDTAHTEHSGHTGHTPLDPPPSILHTVYSAIKNAFTSTASTLTEPSYGAPSYAPPSEPSYGAPSYAPAYPTSYGEDPIAPAAPVAYQPPPPPQPIPSFKPMSWGAVNSYGQPAAPDSYIDYDPRTPTHGYMDYATPKRSVAPTVKKQGLTPEKIQKITTNLKKVTAYINNSQQKRSSEEFKLTDLEAYREMLTKGEIPFLPTPVVSDNEIGVLPAEILDPLPSVATTTSTTTTTTIPTTSTTTAKPQISTEQTRRQDVKYYLRGNKIVQVR